MTDTPFLSAPVLPAPVLDAAVPAAAPVPVVKPDLSEVTVDKAVEDVATVAAPFLPVKVRLALYTGLGIVAVLAPSIGQVFGGQVSLILDGVGAAAAGAVPILAVSHLSD